MVGAFCPRTRENQYVIQVDKDKCIDCVSQEVINRVLQDRRSADEAERHDQVVSRRVLNAVLHLSPSCMRISSLVKFLWG